MILQIDQNLILKSLKKEDVFDIFNVIDTQRVYLGKYLDFVHFTHSILDTENYVRSVLETTEDGFIPVFSIQHFNEFVGLVSFENLDKKNKTTEIGYWLSQNFQKQGFISKSVKALCKYAFDNLRIQDIRIKCDATNIPSKSIPKSLGFQLETMEIDNTLLSKTSFNNLEVYKLSKNQFINQF